MILISTWLTYVICYNIVLTYVNILIGTYMYIFLSLFTLLRDSTHFHNSKTKATRPAHAITYNDTYLQVK